MTFSSRLPVTPEIQNPTGWNLRRAAWRLSKFVSGRGFPARHVRWGSLGRTAPIGKGWGYDRGTPVDRYYIERFLSQWSADVAGRVLEVQDAAYTRRFGGARVVHSDVIDVDPSNPRATMVADLNDAKDLPAGAFDCIILTQTLQFIYEPHNAVRGLERSLAPGGVLLLSVPGITRIPDSDKDGRWYWSFTRHSVQRMLEQSFPASAIDVGVHGNVQTATAFLHGLAWEELRKDVLDRQDPNFPLIVTARAVKPGSS